jgi:hypothetical protein
MLYLSSIKKLADDLGISAAFDGETMTRLESSRDSRDSLQIIVAQAYGMANAYLKENSRSSSSSLILAGGWIEGVHIATSMLDPNEPNEDLIELIADQRFSLQNLISLLEINAEEEEIASLISELKELDTIYAEVNDEESNAVTASESENGTMILGGGSSIDVSSEVLVKITSKVNQIRSKIIG